MRNYVLHVRQLKLVFDNPGAQLRKVKGSHAVPAVIRESINRGVTGLTQEPLQQRLRRLRFRSDYRATQMMNVRGIYLSDALRLSIDIQRVMHVAFEISALGAGVNA